MAGWAKAGEDWADRFMAAALEPHLWEGALGEMAAATGSQHGQIIGFGPGASSFNWISDIDQSVIARSAALDTSAPDLNFRVGADRVRGEADIVFEAHYDIVRESLRADDYLDLCSDFDIPFGCQTRLLANDDLMIGLALLRSSREGVTTQDEREVFSRIAPHVRVAVRMQRAIEEKGFALLSGTFEAVDRACWILDGSGRVGGMTPRAESLMTGNGLRIADGWLTSRHPDHARQIAQAVRAALAPGGIATAPMPLMDDSGGMAMVLEVFPLPTRPFDLSFAPRAIVVARVDPPADRQARALMNAFRLTPAEADIAIRIASGASRQDIAAARGVSTETLKAQLRAVYEKTGCNREAQLVRMVALLAG